ncbi:hypothetical protein OROHE_005230 [Orobanche hederae]
MFPSREKSIIPVKKSPRNFYCSSFKDILHLCSDDASERRLHSAAAAAAPPKPSIFHRIRRVNLVLRAFSSSSASDTRSKAVNGESRPSKESIFIPCAERRVVVYVTSLRVVRSTFEACRTVQSILNGFRVPIDERDLAMDSSYLGELQRILGHCEKTTLTLPRVFIGGRYIGGVDEVRQLHEAGELKKLLQGLPAAGVEICDVCGGHRFILCDECRGSHKCYSEKAGFRSCTACNENGLIRCPSCYYGSI